MESLFNKIAGLQACNFIKKRLQQRCFLVNIAKFLRTPILRNICDGMLLQILIIPTLLERKWAYFIARSKSFSIDFHNSLKFISSLSWHFFKNYPVETNIVHLCFKQNQLRGSSKQIKKNQMH